MKKRLLRYIRVFQKGITGISIELIYPLIVTISAFFLCLIMFVSEMVSR